MRILTTMLLVLSLLCSNACAMGYINYSNQEEFLSDGITQTYICRGISTIEDGVPVAVVCVNGAYEALIEIVDIETGALLRTINTGINGTMWYGCVDNDYNVYCAVGKYLVIYSTQTKTITNAGTVPTTNSGNSNAICFADNGVLYGGASGTGNVYQYKNGKISTLATIGNVSGVNGVAYLSGYVYAGGGTSAIYKINAETGAKQTIANPASKNIKSIGYIYSLNKYILAQLTEENETTHTYVYDTENENWLNLTFDMKANGMTDLCDNKRFFLGTDSYYYSIDANTLEIKKYSGIKGFSYQRGNGSAFSYSKSNGECFLQTQYSGGLYVICPNENTYYSLDTQLKGAPMQRRISRVDENGNVYVCGFMGSSGLMYNTRTKKKTGFNITQGEGMVANGKKMYIGCYTGAEIYMYDSRLSADSQNPRLICDIGDDQDRPFGMDLANNKLLVGTLPKAGTTGGALTIIDTSSYSSKTYRNIIPEHSILSVTHSGNIAYCATSASGGAGAVASVGNRNAHIFSFNIDTGKVIKDVEFKIPNDSREIGAIHGLKISPYNGKLYGSAAGVDFIMNPDTLEVEKYNIYGNTEKITSNTTQLWHENYMQFYDGYLFRTDAIIDPDTLKVIDKAPLEAQFAGIANDKAYFVAYNTDIYSVDINKNETGGYVWDFDDNAQLPNNFAINNKDVVRNLSKKGPNGTDSAFGWLIRIGVGKGTSIINKYSNGFNILKDEIKDNYINNTDICVNLDFMVQNDDMVAYLICPNFGTRTDQFFGTVSLADNKIYAGESIIGECRANEWHNIGAVYRVSDNKPLSYDVYYDGACVAENLIINDPYINTGISYFRIYADAATTDEAYQAAPRFDSRGEYIYIDNLYIGENTDNLSREIEYNPTSSIINGGAYGGIIKNIIPQYENGKLCGVEMNDINVSRRSNVSFDSNGFLWHGLDTMKPIKRR